MQRVGESHREHACSLAIVTDGSSGRGPRTTVVLRVQYVGAGCAQPDFVLAGERQAGIAGGKRAFASRGRRGALALPVLPGVGGGEDHRVAVHRVPGNYAVVAIPEGDAVEETFGIGIG